MLQLSFSSFKQNTYLQVEGGPAAGHFYIIQSGKIRCFHEAHIPGTSDKFLGPGDFVGVISCMSGHSQTESVVAMSDVVAIIVRREQYPELIKNNTPVALKIVRAFSQEMRAMNNELTQLTLKDTVAANPDYLFDIAEYYEDNDLLDVAVYVYYQYIKESHGKYMEEATKRFAQLRKRTHAVYFEPNSDMVREYPRNTMIFSEFQRGQDMFIIQDGTVKITKIVNGEEIMLALLKKGDMFGEMALLDDQLRSASAIAQDNCKLMVVNRANFDQMIATQPQYIARLTTMLAERLWAMYRQLANTQLTAPREKMIDMLALQLEKMRVDVARGTKYNTGFSPSDIISMCGIPQKEQYTAAMQLQNDPNIKLEQGKIVVPDVPELFKQAAFYRKQNNKRKNEV